MTDMRQLALANIVNALEEMLDDQQLDTQVRSDLLLNTSGLCRYINNHCDDKTYTMNVFKAMCSVTEFYSGNFAYPVIPVTNDCPILEYQMSVILGSLYNGQYGENRISLAKAVIELAKKELGR